MLADGKEQQSICYYTVSGVKVITRPAADKQVELIAVDSRTGKPLSKAEVVLYQSKSYQGTDATEKARLRTGQERTLPHRHRGRRIPLCPGFDTTRPLRTATLLSSPRLYDRDDNNTRTALFTDRSLYRPGQTLYFSGIRYINSTSESRTVAG